MLEIYLRKKRKLILPKPEKLTAGEEVVTTFFKNVEDLGYRPTKKLYQATAKLSSSQVQALYRLLIPALKALRGGHKQFQPMYPNFPTEVMEKSDSALYADALLQTWGIRLPKSKKKRSALNEEAEPVNFQLLDLGNKEDFLTIFTQLVGAKSSISEDDKATVSWFIYTYKEEIEAYLPETITIKENLAVVVAELLTHTTISEALLPLVKTPTDVLRIITALSKGDVSLAEGVKFKKLTRRFRKLFLRMLENCKVLEEDMVKYTNRWKRVGEILHPGEFKTKFPRAFKAFSLLRQNATISTYNSKVEAGLRLESTDKILDILTTNPGDFARRLDHILRVSPKNRSAVLEQFRKVSDKVASPVLLQVKSHFEQRSEKNDRVVFPKGSIAKLQVVKPIDGHIPVQECQTVVNIVNETLTRRFSKLEPLGKVYVDPKLKGYLTPYNQRSASKAMRTLIRGSRMPLNGLADTIRYFLWWKDGETRTDIDLTSSVYNDKWEYTADIAYYNLRDLHGTHSGDITSAPRGASEFIDISLSKVKEIKGRYIIMCVNSYTHQPFSSLPECFAGWMERKAAGSGEIYEPKTVANRVDITADTTFCIPMIIDVETREIIWCDIALKSKPGHVNNAEGNNRSMGIVCKAIVEMKRSNLEELLTIHGQARGTLVGSPEEADTEFSVVKETQYDIDNIVANFL